ncbi:MAG TPA: hypothetical protein PK095_01115 [Myxococcota bacterium]|nr:hypothetical protein [Myxococcota bacterium]
MWLSMPLLSARAEVHAGLYDLVGNAAELGVLPRQYADVAVLDRTLLPANPVIFGCAVATGFESCYWPHSPAPGFVDWDAPLVGFRLVRVY